MSALVHQNQYGLRGRDDLQLSKLAGQKRILVFGDSYVWGFGVDQNQIFTAPQVHGTNEDILNFGVSGYGTDQEYLLYQLMRTKFSGDEVIVALTYITTSPTILLLSNTVIQNRILRWRTGS
jgi:hypothetical protein